MPHASLAYRPTDAADAAFDYLTSKPVDEELRKALVSPDFLPSNQVWFRRFLRHVDTRTTPGHTQILGEVGVKCDDGLVLRPALLTGSDIQTLYASHEFGILFQQVLGTRPDDHFWYVEITWPDIYCHKQSCCGSMVFDSGTLEPLLTHLPGICMQVASDGSGLSFLAQDEDAPRSHFRA